LLNIKKLNKLRSSRFTRIWILGYCVAWLSWGIWRWQNPSVSVPESEVHWGEQISILILLLMTTAILIMIAFKLNGWKTDPENPDIKIQTAMISIFSFK